MRLFSITQRTHPFVRVLVQRAENEVLKRVKPSGRANNTSVLEYEIKGLHEIFLRGKKKSQACQQYKAF
jgi:hypothetical protein